jgi:hypothetical protein
MKLNSWAGKRVRRAEVDFGIRNLAMRAPRESELERVEGRLRNLKYSIISWTFLGEAV